eukprot:superscaffoldBa00000263_g3301
MTPQQIKEKLSAQLNIAKSNAIPQKAPDASLLFVAVLSNRANELRGRSPQPPTTTTSSLLLFSHMWADKGTSTSDSSAATQALPPTMFQQ